ncbi:hypothetical protein ABT104_01265 [Streptomyces mobaraensis]
MSEASPRGTYLVISEALSTDREYASPMGRRIYDIRHTRLTK